MYENKPTGDGNGGGSAGPDGDWGSKNHKLGLADNDPNKYKKTEFLDHNEDVEDIFKRWDGLVPVENMPTVLDL